MNYEWNTPPAGAFLDSFLRVSTLTVVTPPNASASLLGLVSDGVRLLTRHRTDRDTRVLIPALCTCLDLTGDTASELLLSNSRDYINVHVAASMEERWNIPELTVFRCERECDERVVNLVEGFCIHPKRFCVLIRFNPDTEANMVIIFIG